VTRRTFLGGIAAASGAGAMRPAPSTMGLSPDCFGVSKGPRTAYEYLAFAHALGAGGVQAVLPSLEPGYLRNVRQRVEELGMYLEITTALPGEDTAQFERVLAASKEAGAYCIRTVCLSGRRYENFNSLEEWNAFVADSRAKVARAAPIAERLRIPVGIENHKDWTIEEMVPLMKQYASEYLGVCIDFGNNISLLDDPMELAESLAPFAVNSHIKDMAVEEYEDGFLLAEVPLGQGMLDLNRILAVIRKHRPGMRFSLDMLTRNPLKITCLTEKYWATFPHRNGRYLARTLAMVRAHKPGKPLQRIDGMDQAAKERFEQQNIRECLDYARDHLGLRPA
jgi:sugar phosphate isomerase/epimerase